MRRGHLTANAKFGNAPSVLVGDFIYTRAFQLMVELDRMALLKLMANTTNTISEGEVLQLVRAGDPSVNEAQYIEVIECKTAVLFAAASCGVGILKQVSISDQKRLSQFGLNLGIAFQMIDDVLDYTGDPEITGKQVGNDLSEGKPTLPLIYTMLQGNLADQDLIKNALTNKNDERLDEVIAAVQRSGGIDYTRKRAIIHQQKALKALSILPPSDALEALVQLTELSINREH